MLRELAEKLHPGHTAVLVVDVQNDFCHPDCELARVGADLTDVRDAVTRIARLVESARSVGALVVFVQGVHIAADIFDVYLEQRHRMWPGAAPIIQDGTWGTRFFELEPAPGETVVRKHRYSAFFGTDLDVILRSRAISTLVMTGVTTEGCVESTARDGFMRDYYIVFTSDGTAAHRREEHAPALERVNRMLGVVCSTGEVIDAWAA